MQERLEISPAERSALNREVKNEIIVTAPIRSGWLPKYRLAAGQSGCKIEIIAGEGERFPHLLFVKKENGTPKNPGTPKYEKAISQIVVEKGYIAIAIERSKESQDHNIFWKKLQRLNQRAFPSSKSA